MVTGYIVRIYTQPILLKMLPWSLNHHPTVQPGQKTPTTQGITICRYTYVSAIYNINVCAHVLSIQRTQRLQLNLGLPMLQRGDYLYVHMYIRFNINIQETEAASVSVGFESLY